MRSVFLLAMALSTAPQMASAKTESVQIKVLATLDRCVGDSATRKADCSKSGAQSSPEDLKIELSKCDDQNAFGANCSGDWEKELAVDGVKFRYALHVAQFKKAKFRYLVDRTICREAPWGDDCARVTDHLHDFKSIYTSKLIGPRIWKSDFRGGSGYDASVMYSGAFEMGEGAGAN